MRTGFAALTPAQVEDRLYDHWVKANPQSGDFEKDFEWRYENHPKDYMDPWEEWADSEGLIFVADLSGYVRVLKSRHGFEVDDDGLIFEIQSGFTRIFRQGFELEDGVKFWSGPFEEGRLRTKTVLRFHRQDLE